MEKYGFVYIWFDRLRKMYYVGCHWGNSNDKYICSSTWMRNTYNRRKHDFKRRIVSIVRTNRKDLYKEEARWLNMIKDEELKIRYYNLKKWEAGHWSLNNDPRSTVEKFTSSIKQKFQDDPEYRIKVGNARRGSKTYNNGIVERGFRDDDIIPDGFVHGRLRVQVPWNKGLNISDSRVKQYSKKHSESLKAKHKSGEIVTWNKGKTGIYSEETLEKISKAGKGRIPWNKKNAKE
jgi:hypothetical protein